MALRFTMSTTAEEVGLLGSYYYVNNPALPLKKTWAVMNIDMLGSRDTGWSRKPEIDYIHALYIDSLNHGVESAFKTAISKVSIHYDSTWLQSKNLIRHLNSDHAPFHLKGIPFIFLTSGIDKDYHELTDTPGKIDFNLLKNQTKLAFLTLWNLANER